MIEIVFFMSELKIYKLFQVKNAKEITTEKDNRINCIKFPMAAYIERKPIFFLEAQQDNQEKAKYELIPVKAKTDGIVKRKM